MEVVEFIEEDKNLEEYRQQKRRSYMSAFSATRDWPEIDPIMV